MLLILFKLHPTEQKSITLSLQAFKRSPRIILQASISKKDFCSTVRFRLKLYLLSHVGKLLIRHHVCVYKRAEFHVQLLQGMDTRQNYSYISIFSWYFIIHSNVSSLEYLVTFHAAVKTSKNKNKIK